MAFWLLLILGLITYIILQQRVASLTRTPVWVLWLVLMMPAFIWIAWIEIYGNTPASGGAPVGPRPAMPPALFLGPFIICPILYWILVHLGRRDMGNSANSRGEEGIAPTITPDGTEPTPPTPVNVGESPSVRLLDAQEEAQLRSCFSWNTYALHQIDYRPQAAICKGALRTKPELAYESISHNIEAKFSDRFCVVFQEDFDGKPLFILVPNPYGAGKMPQALNQPGVCLALAAITLFTTTVAGAQIAGFAPNALSADPKLLLTGLPYALALMTILGCHELGHYFAARFYKVPVTLPYFIPFPIVLGTFGAFIQIRSPMPDRKALFDVSIAGPCVGLLLTLPILIWGLAHSTVVDLPERGGLFSVQALNPRFSLLLTLLSKLVIGSSLTAANGIHLHPVAVAGYIGLIFTALNLMPVGSLDGGHMVHAMFGQRNGALIGQTARMLMLVLTFVQPDFLLWGVFLFLIPIIDSPALNDVTELDNRRDFCGLLALTVLALIILPAPRFI
ncbi:MAG TPA: site-2 protease family protein [Oscillatoriaceae cyanobacterium M33_DOE_052]|uniref:Site-2 protease family protein n=1 Tax=Planktothricoides sp. SpSt-374 TaxID=2282167 RepID=A0A7C3VUU3_9CYAN|nr:site-2 protease family protein [Oscillatoriaceae cyanobacterium M33_DOE_052]